jgi:outer membrane lipoprotein-sorting protein
MRQDPGAGVLTLVFDRKDFGLTQWRIRDAQGVVTSVILQRIKLGVELDDSLFRYVEKAQSLPRN